MSAARLGCMFLAVAAAAVPSAPMAAAANPPHTPPTAAEVTSIGTRVRPAVVAAPVNVETETSTKSTHSVTKTTIRSVKECSEAQRKHFPKCIATAINDTSRCKCCAVDCDTVQHSAGCMMMKKSGACSASRSGTAPAAPVVTSGAANQSSPVLVWPDPPYTGPMATLVMTLSGDPSLFTHKTQDAIKSSLAAFMKCHESALTLKIPKYITAPPTQPFITQAGRRLLWDQSAPAPPETSTQIYVRGPAAGLKQLQAAFDKGRVTTIFNIPVVDMKLLHSKSAGAALSAVPLLFAAALVAGRMVL